VALLTLVSFLLASGAPTIAEARPAGGASVQAKKPAKKKRKAKAKQAKKPKRSKRKASKKKRKEIEGDAPEKSTPRRPMP